MKDVRFQPEKWSRDGDGVWLCCVSAVHKDKGPARGYTMLNQWDYSDLFQRRAAVQRLREAVQRHLEK